MLYQLINDALVHDSIVETMSKLSSFNPTVIVVFSGSTDPDTRRCALPW